MNENTVNPSLKEIEDVIDYYYSQNPDTLMPLLLVALAANGKMTISSTEREIDEVYRSYDLLQLLTMDWVKQNEVLKKKILGWQKQGKRFVSIDLQLDDWLFYIYYILREYDEVTVEYEYHHRIGLLYDHSSGNETEKMQRDFAAYILSDVLLNISSDFYERNYLYIYNYLLVKSGIQPARPRKEVAEMLVALLDYQSGGVVYNPFAGCSFVGTMLNAGENLYADGDANEKLYALGLLLNYGMKGNNKHFVQRDSTKWIEGVCPSYVTTTYRGYIQGIPAIYFCLEKCMHSLADNGKFAGVISPKDFFGKPAGIFKTIVKKDWLDTVVMFPFNEIAVLVNKQKDESRKGQVRLFNMLDSTLCNKKAKDLLHYEQGATVVTNEMIKKHQYNLKPFFERKMEAKENYELKEIKTLLKCIKPKTYQLDRENEWVMLGVNRTKPYDSSRSEFYDKDAFVRKTIQSMFKPAYKLHGNLLIVNRKHREGLLEPRLYEEKKKNVFFDVDDGMVFQLLDEAKGDKKWWVNELQKPYVMEQLYPYGKDCLLPEVITPDKFLSLKLWKPKNLHDENYETALNVGFELFADETTKYKITDDIFSGGFGITYLAEKLNLDNGKSEEVVLKEFFMRGYCFRAKDGSVKYNLKDEVEKYRLKFVKEARIMQELGADPDNHIMHVRNVFEDKKTRTLYYEMKNYPAGSLDKGKVYPEEYLIKHIVIPLSKALHQVHKRKVLHLDVKPGNILLDENDDAVLIDFGIAKRYDEKGVQMTMVREPGTDLYSPPEQKNGSMEKFTPATDVFALAATCYKLLTGNNPVVVFGNSNEKERIYRTMEGCSDKTKDAIVKGLANAMDKRPQTMADFLHLFPECEDISFE